MEQSSIRPYTLVPSSALAAIERAAREALSSWCQAWGAPADAFDVEAHRLEEAALPAPADEWHALHAAWCWKSSSLNEAVATAVGLPWPAAQAPGRSISTACCTEAVTELSAAMSSLLRDLRQLSGTATPSLPGPSCDPGAGHGLVLLCLKHGLTTFALVAHASSFKAVSQARPEATAPLKAEDLALALRAQTATLEVVLGHAEISLADMMDLGPGDVVLLDRHIHQALVMTSSDGKVELPVHLGRQGQHFAVQLGGTPSH